MTSWGICNKMPSFPVLGQLNNLNMYIKQRNKSHKNSIPIIFFSSLPCGFFFFLPFSFFLFFLFSFFLFLLLLLLRTSSGYLIMHQKQETCLPSRGLTYQSCLGGDRKQETYQDQMEVCSRWFTILQPKNFPGHSAPKGAPKSFSVFRLPSPTPAQVTKRCDC